MFQFTNLLNFIKYTHKGLLVTTEENYKFLIHNRESHHKKIPDIESDCVCVPINELKESWEIEPPFIEQNDQKQTLNEIWEKGKNGHLIIDFDDDEYIKVI